MNRDIISQIVVASFYIATLLFYNWRDRKRLRVEREIYTSTFEKAMDLLGDSHIRVTRRMHFLNTCDWAYARGTHQNLLGLSFFIAFCCAGKRSPYRHSEILHR